MFIGRVREFSEIRAMPESTPKLQEKTVVALAGLYYGFYKKDMRITMVESLGGKDGN